MQFFEMFANDVKAAERFNFQLFEVESDGVGATFATVVIGFVGLLWHVLNRLTPFNDEHELFDKHNYAYLLQRLGLCAAQVIAMLAVVPDFDTAHPWWSSVWLLVEGLYVMVAILTAKYVVDWALMPKIKKLRPDSFEDMTALVALFRPGPLQSGMVDDFIARKHGEAAVAYPHPDLEPILKPTYGVILYQEQVMQIAQVLALSLIHISEPTRPY